MLRDQEGEEKQGPGHLFSPLPCGIWSQRSLSWHTAPWLGAQVLAIGSVWLWGHFSVSGWLKKHTASGSRHTKQGSSSNDAAESEMTLRSQGRPATRTKGRQRPLVQSSCCIPAGRWLARTPHAGVCFICRGHSGKLEPSPAHSGLTSFSRNDSYHCP